jgi:predicted dehydrogenase
VGIIGCGGISNSHLRGYREIPRVEVVGGADVSEAVRRDRESRGDGLGIPRMYATAAELRRARIDLPPAERGHPLEAMVAAGETGLAAAAPVAGA